jgi:hypothetical protein
MSCKYLCPGVLLNDLDPRELPILNKEDGKNCKHVCRMDGIYGLIGNEHYNTFCNTKNNYDNCPTFKSKRNP